jgi:hypothetical protein
VTSRIFSYIEVYVAKPFTFNEYIPPVMLERQHGKEDISFYNELLCLLTISI